MLMKYSDFFTVPHLTHIAKARSFKSLLQFNINSCSVICKGVSNIFTILLLIWKV